MAPSAREEPRVARSIRRVALGYRIVGVAWAGLIAIAHVASGDAPAPTAFTVVALAAVWTLGVVLARGAGRELVSPWFVSADVAIAAATIALPAALDVAGVAGGYPFAAVLHAAALIGVRAGLAAAAPLGLLSAGAPLAVGQLAEPATVEVAVFYLASAAVIGWGGKQIRAAEERSRAERAARAIAEERAATAARLHDSVLQTLALVQRREEIPEEVRGLARRQEHELRGWLFGAPSGAATDHADEAPRERLEAIAREAETAHPHARVEVVAVGDPPDDPAVRSLVEAVGEAIRNACAHAGAERVDVYVEALGDEVVAHVRDRGVGFDPDAVPAGHGGIAESIRGRLDRAGGVARVRAAPGQGCDWELRVPTETAGATPPTGS
ncbi:hypothetical protein ER308_06205 [Egibacter rhizosphaerae]|uniref:Histidine kinase/HSP90-like ATPase domain-containing protein n=1 Tax=Egibacter rhizosphaerae TaxID=1670831 RepID=A0A411YD62_9ACTN|nr:ATP-binding protein [Egibacter rhizosphaerae]QBI19171.1 hypothetical protein ER308_06205 [Egibacter rhizosphaerae]